MPVLAERDTEFVAQFRFTAILMPNGLSKITGLPFDQALYKSDLKTKDADIKAILSQPIKAAGGGKKKKAAAVTIGGDATAAAKKA